MPNVERLKQLHRVVSDAPDDLFHMPTWSMCLPCGTAHCALGWAALDPWFLENTEIGGLFAEPSEDGYFTSCVTTTGADLAKLFDIERNDSNNLFCYDSGSTGRMVEKQRVLDNIDRILRGEKTVPYWEL